MRYLALLACLCVAPLHLGAQPKAGLQPSDLFSIQAVGDVKLSPNGTHVAYSVTRHDRPGRPSSEVWIKELATGSTRRLEDGSGVRWSPDGTRIAYFGSTLEGSGLVVADAAGGRPRRLAEVHGTNHPLPSAGERLAWSPDGRALAFVSATPADAHDDVLQADPVVITRYLYKPTASEGLTRFNDNRRLHIFVVDVLSGQVRQLTDGNYYEHSLDWSPRGDRLAFVSNREADPDRVFNYDIFTVTVKDAAVSRVTSSKSAEYFPVWSPDGTRLAFSGTTRDLTSSETTMEDTHVWTVNAGGSRRREAGKQLDSRQGPPQWSTDGAHLYFTAQHRGDVRLMRMVADGGRAEAVVSERGVVGAWSLARDVLAYAFTPPDAPADLRVASLGNPHKSPTVAGTPLNRDLLEGRTVAPVDAFTFESFDGTEIEAFLTKPIDAPNAGDRPSDRSDKHPLIVIIHGGPHGQQGAAFNSKAQVYAGRGWASLMVNYRGSTGYGQELTDAIFKDQNGGEAKDVLAGVDAALARYRWLDAERIGIEGGSYGGQLTNWLVTQTSRFKAAIASAGISNLVSFNYMAYYHDYLAVEFGAYPHERDIIEKLWERSPIRLAKHVRTPTMFIHGENDNDVPIAEAEQFYIALHDVGVETVLVRYPREGHGLRETGHVVDALERSIAWYRKYFDRVGTSR